MDEEFDSSIRVEKILDGVAEQSAKEKVTEEERGEEVLKAKKTLLDFMNYIKSSSFIKKCNSLSRKTGIPPKKIAKGFFSNILGTIADILNIAIDTIQIGLAAIVEFLSWSIVTGGSIVCELAKGLVRVCTLNNTSSSLA